MSENNSKPAPVAQTAPVARMAPVVGEAPHTTTDAPTAGVALNNGQQMHAIELFNVPSASDLALSLNQLTKDTERHAGLFRLLNTPSLITQKNAGNIGKFLSAQDWKNVVWAATAWHLFMNLPDEIEQRADGKATAQKLATTLRATRRSISKRAAKIWTPDAS